MDIKSYIQRKATDVSQHLKTNNRKSENKTQLVKNVGKNLSQFVRKPFERGGQALKEMYNRADAASDEKAVVVFFSPVIIAAGATAGLVEATAINARAGVKSEALKNLGTGIKNAPSNIATGTKNFFEKFKKEDSKETTELLQTEDEKLKKLSALAIKDYEEMQKSFEESTQNKPEKKTFLQKIQTKFDNVSTHIGVALATNS